MRRRTVCRSEQAGSLPRKCLRQSLRGATMVHMVARLDTVLSSLRVAFLAVPALALFFVGIGGMVGCIPPAGNGARPGPAPQIASRSGEDDDVWNSVERDVVDLAAVTSPAERDVRAFRLCLAATSLESRHPGKYPELTDFYHRFERRSRPPIIVEACGAVFERAVTCYQSQRRYWRECSSDLDATVADSQSRLVACVHAVDDLTRAPGRRNGVRGLFRSGLLDQARSLMSSVRSPTKRQAENTAVGSPAPLGKRADSADAFLPPSASDEENSSAKRMGDHPQRTVAPADASSYGLGLLTDPPGAVQPGVSGHHTKDWVADLLTAPPGAVQQATTKLERPPEKAQTDTAVLPGSFEHLMRTALPLDDEDAIVEKLSSPLFERCSRKNEFVRRRCKQELPARFRLAKNSVFVLRLDGSHLTLRPFDFKKMSFTISLKGLVATVPKRLHPENDEEGDDDQEADVFIHVGRHPPILSIEPVFPGTTLFSMHLTDIDEAEGWARRFRADPENVRVELIIRVAKSWALRATTVLADTIKRAYVRETMQVPQVARAMASVDLSSEIVGVELNLLGFRVIDPDGNVLASRPPSQSRAVRRDERLGTKKGEDEKKTYRFEP